MSAGMVSAVVPIARGRLTSGHCSSIGGKGSPRATTRSTPGTCASSDFNSGWRIDVSGGSGDYVVVLGSTVQTGDEIFADGFD